MKFGIFFAIFWVVGYEILFLESKRIQQTL